MASFANYDFKGQKALIRVDFNVPLNDKYEITDDTRMRAAVPTIKKILADGGMVILMSHLGRPKEGPTDKYSLKHLITHLSQLLGGTRVLFANHCIGEQAYLTASMMRPGEVLLLENLRFYKEEEKGNEAFAEKLSRLGDVWVNDEITPLEFGLHTCLGSAQYNHIAQATSRSVCSRSYFCS